MMPGRADVTEDSGGNHGSHKVNTVDHSSCSGDGS
eukprot:CAMPEP_0185793998 /NCGR_PEP_ID=MMETSP1174-20130828/159778_1 /TAXON_ID=35687 /ORGANISM="Dictyocha speculum, Strain CCMP1381" /LENGTH=34 /DNA_ID= /DNA_START= /DNA_END= /DNA_ORIENTATION=